MKLIEMYIVFYEFVKSERNIFIYRFMYVNYIIINRKLFVIFFIYRIRQRRNITLPKKKLLPPTQLYGRYVFLLYNTTNIFILVCYTCAKVTFSLYALWLIQYGFV